MKNIIKDSTVIDNIKVHIDHAIESGGRATIEVTNVQTIDINKPDGWTESTTPGRMTITINIFPEDMCIGIV